MSVFVNVTHLLTQARHLVVDAFLSLPALFPPISKRSSMDIDRTINDPHFTFSSLKLLPCCIDDCSSRGWCLLAGALQSPVHTATERCRKSFPGSPFLQEKKAAQSHCSVCRLSHTPLVYKVLYGWIFSPQGLCLCCLFPFDQPSCSLLNATFVPQVRGHLFPEVFPDLWPGLGLFLSVCLEKSFLTSPTATY